jgi:hypothetical protein
LALGARSDKLDTWCRETIGKDYLALSEDDRTRLVTELQDEFQANERLAALNNSQLPVPNQNLNTLRPMQQQGAVSKGAPISNPTVPSVTITQSIPYSSSPESNSQPTEPEAVPATPTAQTPKVADAAPSSDGAAHTYPDQRAHDLDDLEVLRKLNFKADGPPTIEKGGARVYKGSKGTVRVR